MPITTTDALAHACTQLATSSYVTIDTEFIREKTYYPVLCLVQLASDEHEYMVDPLAEGIDLSPLFELLQNSKVTKVFHSGKQDIEIFYHLTGNIPQNVFDTQIAAMVCGFGAAASYASLVEQIAGKTLDKSSRFTDWSRRPLTEKQLHYAIGDVTYLRDIYKNLVIQLNESERDAWVKEEMDVLLSPDTYRADLEKLWLKLSPKGASKQFLGVLKAMVEWREKTAIRLNKPRNHIVKDAALLEYAAIIPKTLDDFNQLRGMNRVQQSLRPSLLEAITAAQPVKKEGPQKKKPISPKYKPLLELLRVLLADVANKNKVAERLIATGDDLKMIALGEHEATSAMHGWRYDIFGKQAESLCKGEIALTIKNQEIEAIPLARKN